MGETATCWIVWEEDFGGCHLDSVWDTEEAAVASCGAWATRSHGGSGRDRGNGMAERKWHLEHSDGREWAQDELDALVREVREGTSRRPFDERCQGVCVTPLGDVVLLDTWGEWVYMDPREDDMVVVYD